MMKNNNFNQRADALDGIRVLAIISVILYHIMPYIVSGGFLGVDIFLILAGYLLTIKIRQDLSAQRFEMVKYLKRRIGRLYRPMLTTIIVSLSFVTLFVPDLLMNSRLHVLESLTFTTNWMQIIRGESYFDMYLSPNIYNHLWYVALYIQLIILLPIIITVFQRYVKHLKGIAYLLMGLSVISAVLMGIWFQPGIDPTRVYYGTDTRAFSFLMGVLLAYLWPYNRLREDITTKQAQVLNGLNMLSLLVVGLFIFHLNDKSPWTYRGGIFVFDLFSMFLIAITLHHKTILNKIFTLSVFKQLSKRSFYYYLWYFPVITIYEFRYSQIMPGFFWHVMSQLLIIFILGEVLYQLFEKHYYQGFFSVAFWKESKQVFQEWRQNQTIHTRKIAQLFLIALLPLIAGWGLMTAPSKAANSNHSPNVNKQLNRQSDKQVKQSEKKTTKQKDKMESDQGTPENPEPLVPSDDREASDESDDKNKEIKPALPMFPGLSKAERAFAQDLDVTFYGDSILLGVQDNLQTVFQNSNVNGLVGRQLYQSYNELQQMLQSGQIQHQIVIFLGTNGGFSIQQVESLIELLDGHEVAFVNANVDRSWETEVNNVYQAIHEKYPKVQIIDWKSFSNGQTDWFGDDGVHPNELGREKMVQLVVKSLKASHSSHKKSNK
ncbi:acyltransferase family protein [Atopobacter phocae]|uniref:acyltransferase family protein n=1 Tax=Atopobacter phocae TaxID=136492 RepID=UPI0004710834|nr:acyltransferase family protein [Atopobacter phocae]